MSVGTLARQFVSFVGVGVLGFAVDATIFLLMTNEYFGWPIHWARTLSALCSITTTWALNRRITFASQKSRDKKAEYTRYLLAQIFGLGVNIGIFAACLLIVPALRPYPVIALAIGAVSALLVNFFTARTVAFRKLPTR